MNKQQKVNSLVFERLDSGVTLKYRSLSRRLSKDLSVSAGYALQMIYRARNRWRKEKGLEGVKRKRLFFDIEISFALGWFWRTGFRQTISAEQVIEDQRIICVSYKWEGEEKVKTLVWKDGCDKELVQQFAEVLDKATEIVAHNGDRFDMNWLRTRALMHGIEMNPYHSTKDTLKMSKKLFKFRRNRLGDIAIQLGVGEKLSTDIDLWKDVVLKKDKKALKRMVEYCEQDVIVLEDVYARISKYAKPKAHYGVLDAEPSWGCPECGSEKVVYLKPRTTASGTVKRQFQCACGQFYETNNRKYVDFFEAKHKHRYTL